MIKILNIPLYSYGLQNAIKEVITICNTESVKKNRCLSATGAHGLVFAKKNKDFANILNEFYMNFPDGTPAVWVGRLKGAKKMAQCSGPDFFQGVMLSTVDFSIKHYICGGNKGVADALKMACEQKFHNNNIVGTYCPPFRVITEIELEQIAQDINNRKTDILWIGLSTPKQEFFANRISKITNVHFIVTVGAAFDFHIGRVKKAPKWISKCGLEWLFRLCNEPKRLWKRYFEIVPKFIYYNLKELIIKK